MEEGCSLGVAATWGPGGSGSGVARGGGAPPARPLTPPPSPEGKPWALAPGLPPLQGASRAPRPQPHWRACWPRLNVLPRNPPLLSCRHPTRPGSGASPGPPCGPTATLLTSGPVAPARTASDDSPLKGKAPRDCLPQASSPPPSQATAARTPALLRPACPCPSASAPAVPPARGLSPEAPSPLAIPRSPHQDGPPCHPLGDPLHLRCISIPGCTPTWPHRQGRASATPSQERSAP